MNSNGEKIEMHMPESAREQNSSHITPIIGVIIIMLVLIFGGLYLWGGILSAPAPVVPLENPIINNEPETPRAEVDAEILNTLSPSDEISAIEADLESTNIDSIDTDLTTIDAEFNAALAQ